MQVVCSAAAGGWAGWALAHPEFGSSVNPITTRGTDYDLHITASPPGFENPVASLILNTKNKNGQISRVTRHVFKKPFTKLLILKEIHKC